ncbi:MAG: flagellar hook-associated protein FlgK [Flavobacteriaceae bacterium]
MGLTTAISSALSGLSATQAGVDLVSRNIANADSAGYIRKTALQEALVAGGTVRGVQVSSIQRELDTLLQKTLQTEASGSGYADIVADYLGRVDTIFGEPGGANALDTIYANYQSAAHALAASPEDANARGSFLSAAQTLVQQLNSLSGQLQSMRLEIEQRLDSAVSGANDILARLQQINSAARSGGVISPDLLDTRDKLVSDLSRLMDIQVTTRDDGTVSIRTKSGVGLLDGTAETLVFDGVGYMDANQLYSRDAAQRGVGTISIRYGTGVTVDLLADNSIRGGEIGGLIDLRDELLVTAQNQLDAIAAGLSRAASDIDVPGTEVTSGAQEGFALDFTGIQPGDTITLRYTQTPPGTQQTVTFFNTTNPSGLPANGAATPVAGDTVIGIDFSQSPAAVVADIQAALGANFTVSNPSGNAIQILDDGAAGTIDISGLDGLYTQTDNQNGNAALSLFVDGITGAAYSGAYEGDPQIRGYAGRIQLNGELRTDPSLLVKFTPSTSSGDDTRPAQLLDRLTGRRTAMGAVGGSFVGTIGDFIGRVINYQAGQAADAQTAKEAQDIVVNQLNERFADKAGVDIDVEMTLLIQLQQAFQANARVIQATQEMMDALLGI